MQARLFRQYFIGPVRYWFILLFFIYHLPGGTENFQGPAPEK